MKILTGILFAIVLLAAQASAQLTPIPGSGPLPYQQTIMAVDASGVFVGGASSYLKRTLGTPTSGTTWTAAFWFKASSYGTTVFNSDSAGDLILFSSGTFEISDTGSGSGAVVMATSTPTDTTTWHLYVLRYDSTQATATNRVVIEIDGVNVTNTGGTFPSLNAASGIYASGSTPYFGTDINGGPRLGLAGKAALYYFVDGKSLPSANFSFGTGSGTTHPKAYNGALGNNGSFVSFCNNAALGNDDGSGAQCSNAGSNNWTNTGVTQSTSDFPK